MTVVPFVTIPEILPSMRGVENDESDENSKERIADEQEVLMIVFIGLADVERFNVALLPGIAVCSWKRSEASNKKVSQKL